MLQGHPGYDNRSTLESLLTPSEKITILISYLSLVITHQILVIGLRFQPSPTVYNLHVQLHMQHRITKTSTLIISESLLALLIGQGYLPILIPIKCYSTCMINLAEYLSMSSR